MSENAEGKKIAAPYIPFNTFTTALDNIAAHNVPNVIDRSSFPSFSGASVAGTLSALRYFSLIDSEGKPSETLHTLAMDKDGRKKNIRALLESRYGDLIALDLSRATPSQFDGAFSNETFNVSGDTRTKAKTFFIKAAQFTEIPISKLLLNKSRATGTRKPRKAKSDSGNGGATDATVTPAVTPPAASQTSKTVEFTNGGKLTLSLDVNLLELKGKDRAFVFDLIDRLEAYESPSDE